MLVGKDKIDVDRLLNLARAFDWGFKCVDKTDSEIIVSFKKPRVEPIPEEAVGAD